MKPEHTEKITMTEKMVIGYCMNGNIHEALNLGLRSDMFIDKDYSAIFSAMIKADLSEKGNSIEAISANISNVASMAIKLAECLEVSTTQNTTWMIKSIVKGHNRRNLLAKVREVYNDGVNADPLDDYSVGEKLLALVDNDDGRNECTVYGSSTGLVIDTLSLIEKDIQSGGMKGIKTGIEKLDQALGGGLKPNRLYTIAARPGCGKTALATNICYNAGKDGYVTLYMTIELNQFEVTERMFCLSGKINTQSMDTRLFSGDETDRLVYASSQVNSTKYWVAPKTGGDWDKAMAVMRFYTRYRGVNLIIIDYIQQFQIRGKKLTAREQLTTMTGDLKAFAMANNIPVLMVAQMNREVDKRQNKSPLLSDLKESGSIEQDSDVVIMLAKEQEKNQYRDEVEVLVAYLAKNRQGKSGMVVLDADFSTNTIKG